MFCTISIDSLFFHLFSATFTHFTHVTVTHHRMVFFGFNTVTAVTNTKKTVSTGNSSTSVQHVSPGDLVL